MSSERPREPIFPDERSSVWHPRSGAWLRARRRRSVWRWVFDLFRGAK